MTGQMKIMRLWKIRDLFEILNAIFSKFYNPFENLDIDEVILSFKGKVIFKQYIPKNASVSASKFSNFVTRLDTHMIYLGKGRQRTAQHVTATHVTVTELTRKRGRGHKLYMDNFFSSPELFDDLVKKQIYCCGTVRLNRKCMTQDLRPKTTKLKMGDICIRTRANLTAIQWQDKRDICLLTNINDAPVEDNFCNDGGKAIKLHIVMDYNHHMDYVDKGDRMANSYSNSRHMFKWTKQLFFHLLDLAILNSCILHSSCGGKKMSHNVHVP